MAIVIHFISWVVEYLIIGVVLRFLWFCVAVVVFVVATPLILVAAAFRRQPYHRALRQMYGKLVDFFFSVWSRL